MPKHNVCIYNLVRSMGFEPIRDFSHHPLKVACLPFHHDRVFGIKFINKNGAVERI